MEIVELSNEKEFGDFVKEGVVLVDFFAEWCMPCVMMAPVFEEVAGKFDGKIKFGKVNLEDSEELGQKFGISSIPSFILFKDGEVSERFEGSMTAEEFEDNLKRFV